MTKNFENYYEKPYNYYQFLENEIRFILISDEITDTSIALKIFWNTKD